MKKVSFKQYTFDVNQAITDIEFDLPSDAKKVTGIRFDSPEDVLLSNRGGARVEISNRELFPENFSCRMLMFGQEVGANERLHVLDETLDSNKMKVRFTDKPSPSSPNTANYPVTITIRYQNYL